MTRLCFFVSVILLFTFPLSGEEDRVEVVKIYRKEKSKTVDQSFITVEYQKSSKDDLTPKVIYAKDSSADETWQLAPRVYMLNNYSSARNFIRIADLNGNQVLVEPETKVGWVVSGNDFELFLHNGGIYVSLLKFLNVIINTEDITIFAAGASVQIESTAGTGTSTQSVTYTVDKGNILLNIPRKIYIEDTGLVVDTLKRSKIIGIESDQKKMTIYFDDLKKPDQTFTSLKEAITSIESEYKTGELPWDVSKYSNRLTNTTIDNVMALYNETDENFIKESIVEKENTILEQLDQPEQLSYKLLLLSKLNQKAFDLDTRQNIYATNAKFYQKASELSFIEEKKEKFDWIKLPDTTQDKLDGIQQTLTDNISSYITGNEEGKNKAYENIDTYPIDKDTFKSIIEWEGEKLYNQSQFDEAKDLFDISISLGENIIGDPRYRYIVNDTYYQCGTNQQTFGYDKTLEAILNLKKSITYGNYNGYAYLRLADNYLDLKEYEEARGVITLYEQLKQEGKITFDEQDSKIIRPERKLKNIEIKIELQEKFLPSENRWQ